jgi:hypothetical protein
MGVNKFPLQRGIGSQLLWLVLCHLACPLQLRRQRGAEM